MKFEIEFLDNNDSSYIISLYILGILSALSKNVISIDNAESAIFLPKFVAAAEKMELDPKLVALIWEGMELDGVDSLAPDKLDQTIIVLKTSILELIKKYEKKGTPMERLTIFNNEEKFEAIDTHYRPPIIMGSDD